MSKIVNFLLIAIVSVAMSGIISCKEKAPPAPKPQVVKQKITDQQAKPAEKPPVSSPMVFSPISEPSATQAGAPSSKIDVPVPGEDGNQTVSELIKESMSIAVGYDAKGRFDPFEPLFKEESSTRPAAVSKEKRKKRKPQTPLERVAISQLKLSAIMRTAKGNSAIVEDASGKGYVIRKGTYIGLNAGQVVRIDKDQVVIEEEKENVMGELVIQNTELKLQKPAGEL